MREWIDYSKEVPDNDIACVTKHSDQRRYPYNVNVFVEYDDYSVFAEDDSTVTHWKYIEAIK